jgi:hypothetical protein
MALQLLVLTGFAAALDMTLHAFDIGGVPCSLWIDARYQDCLSLLRLLPPLLLLPLLLLPLLLPPLLLLLLQACVQVAVPGAVNAAQLSNLTLRARWVQDLGLRAMGFKGVQFKHMVLVLHPSLVGTSRIRHSAAYHILFN